MRRWTRRILIALGILIAVVLIVTQVVLWTDYPRRIVLSLVERELGLRVQAASMSTGWFGNTTLNDVKISLPLAEESFFDVPEMRVSHTALIPLAITQKFELDALELEKPNLLVRREQNGRWNAQDVIELVLKAIGGKPEPGTKQKPPKLPRVKLIDGTVRVIERNGRNATIAPLDVVGYPDGPLVYRYDATVPDRLKVVGEVAPGENWKHEFNVNAKPGAWLTPWVPSVPDPLVLNAQWTGVLNDGTVVGRLVIEDAKAAAYGARGRLAAQFGRGGAGVINPQNLTITTPLADAPTLQITSGAVNVTGQKLRLSQLRVAALGGQAQLDGDADLAARSGDVRGVWFDVSAPAPPDAKIRHGGNLQFSVRSPFPGRPEVNGSIVTRGKTPRGDWEGEIKIDGSGRDWSDMDWIVMLARASWDGKTDAALQNFTVRLAQRGQMIRLADVSWPGHQVTARGEMDLDSKVWSIRFNGTDTLKTTFDFGVVAHGNARVYTLEELTLRARQAELKAHGVFDKEKPEPVALTVYLSHLPQTWLVPEHADHAPIKGILLAEAKVTGTVDRDKFELKLVGSLTARDLVAFDRNCGDIRGDLEGQITRSLEGNITRTDAAFTVKDLLLFGGRWRVAGAWPYKGDDKLTATPDPMRVTIGVQDLSLTEVGELLNRKDVSGAAQGNWIIDVPLPKPRRDQIAARGELRTGRVAVGGPPDRSPASARPVLGGPAVGGHAVGSPATTSPATTRPANGSDEDLPLSADEIIATMELRNGVFRADPIKLTKTVADARGTANVNVQLALSSPRQPDVDLAADAWPLQISETGTAAVWAKSHLTVDFGTRQHGIGASGPLNLRAKIATTQQAVGELVVDGQLAGRRGTFERITFDALGGHAEGRAVVDADAPNQTNATFAWTGIDSARLVGLFPQLNGLSGTFGGAMAIAPAKSPRALEPLRLTLGVDPDGEAHFRTMKIGPARLSAFMNIAANFSPERLVLDESVEEIRQQEIRERELDRQGVDPAQRPLAWNDIRIADGRVLLWARRSRHEAGEIQTHVIADFQRLDLDQLVHALAPAAQLMPGRLTGRAIVHGDPRDLNLVLAQGHVQITESDLANVDGLALLYNILSVGQSKRGNIGAGQLDFSLQSSTLTLNDIHYFNRGVEAWSNSVSVGDFWHMPHSPISGYVVGTARPLSALKLPFLADVDQIMSVLQSNLATVKLEGTVADPKPKQATFADVGEGLQRFMRGQVTAAQQK